MTAAYGVSAADAPSVTGRRQSVPPPAERPAADSVRLSALRITAYPSSTASTSSPLSPCQSTRPSCAAISSSPADRVDAEHHVLAAGRVAVLLARRPLSAVRRLSPSRRHTGRPSAGRWPTTL